MFMAEIYSLQCLPSYVLHERLWYPPLIPIQLVKHRVVAVLEHQVKPPLPPEDFQEVDQVGVLELLLTSVSFVFQLFARQLITWASTGTEGTVCVDKHL